MVVQQAKYLLIGIRFCLKVSKHLLGEILNFDGNQYLKGHW